MICLKISTFVVSTTTASIVWSIGGWLWFAWKYLPLWYQQQHYNCKEAHNLRCDLLENIYLCGINNSWNSMKHPIYGLWFAWKYLPLWYQQQLQAEIDHAKRRCDLLENIYLCGINNSNGYVTTKQKRLWFA